MRLNAGFYFMKDRNMKEHTTYFSAGMACSPPIILALYLSTAFASVCDPVIVYKTS